MIVNRVSARHGMLACYTIVRTNRGYVVVPREDKTLVLSKYIASKRQAKRVLHYYEGRMVEIRKGGASDRLQGAIAIIGLVALCIASSIVNVA